MRLNFLSKMRRHLIFPLLPVLVGLAVTSATGGPYSDSAHGNAVYGVNRSALDSRYADYSPGNCSHCHEIHASLSGSNPLPGGGPAPHALFAPGFNNSRTGNPYLEADNFCFYCHSDGSGPMVQNHDYSTTFGGGSTSQGPQSIMAAFNQTSYHNLYDIKMFLENDSSYSAWFARRNNPCSGCHDPHRARRNSDSTQSGFPLVSAITRPGSTNLWGESEVMLSYSSYEAPYSELGVSREPAGVGEENGANTPDYVTFCSSCHNADKTIWSTTLNRNLRQINWGQTGINLDKHGSITRDGQTSLREPYLSAAPLKNNFVLSCLDCHEAHGSENIMLLRARINGEALPGAIDSSAALGYSCGRCHQDDQAAGIGPANSWEHVHHGVADAPYARNQCSSCHGAGAGGSVIDCGNCHGHGMNDSWAGARQSGRTTF